MSEKKTLAPIPWTVIPASMPIILVAGLVLYNEWGSERGMDALRKALRIVEEEGLGELEPRGREYASKRDARVTFNKDIDKFYLPLIVMLNSLSRALDEAMSFWRAGVNTELYQTVQRVQSVVFNYMSDTATIADILAPYIAYAETPVFRRDKLSKIIPREYVDQVCRTVRDLDKHQKKLTGRSCVWILNKVEDEESYTFSGLMNDVTACVHSLLNYIRFALDPDLVKEYDKVYVKNGNRVLVEGAKTWAKILTTIHKYEVVSDNDYYPTIAIVSGSRAEIVVGSTPGHTTHVEVGDGVVEATYYDTDEKVHSVLIEVAKALGVKVVEHKEREYTVFSAPVGDSQPIFKMLPFATSLDFRIESDWSQKQFWSGLIPPQDFEKIRESSKSIEEAEVKLILTAIEKLKTLFPSQLTG
jgi:hypothetical protein